MAEVVDYTGRTRKIVSNDVQKADFNAIPIISLKAITETGATKEDKQALVRELQDACMRVGFFYVKWVPCVDATGLSDLKHKRSWYRNITAR